MSVARAASAGFWSGVDVVVRQSVQFVVSIILARILAPADFGIIALIMFFSSLSQVFIQGGLTTALVQRQATSVEEESTVFWVNLAASGLFALALVAIAPALARFYGHAVLQPLMLVAAAQVVLSALGAVQTALLSRQLDFAHLAKAGVASAILSGATGIVAAMMGKGVWALALQSLVATASYSAALWLVCGWRPHARFRLASIRELFGFGAWLSVSSILDVVYTQGFSLLLGKLYGVSDLGLYNRASGTQQLPSSVLSVIIGRVALPLFSPRADDQDATRRGMRMAIGFAMILNVPMMAGLALLPDLVIRTLFGDKWLPAAPILSILAISGLLYPLHVINLQVLLARGGSKTFFQIEMAKKLAGITCIAIGSFFGIQGLAWSQVAASILALLLNSRPTARTLGYGALHQLRDLVGIFAAAAVMSAVVLLLSPALQLAAPIKLSVLAGTGALTYFAAGAVLRLRSFTEAFDVVRLLLAGRRERVVPAQ